MQLHAILFNFIQFCSILFNFVLARMFYSLPAAAQVPRIQLKRKHWRNFGAEKTFDFPIFLNMGRILELKTFDFPVFLAVTESLSLTEDNHWRNLEDENFGFFQYFFSRVLFSLETLNSNVNANVNINVCQQK